MDKYQPPITITEEIVNLVAEISEHIGRVNFEQRAIANPRLRRDSRIKTIHSSLAIENNSLSIDQVTAIINGKRVLGKQAEIREVKNAYEAYEKILEFNPYSDVDLLKAHKLMMKDLVSEVGMYRTGGVGVFAKDKLVHMAPPAEFVCNQIRDLLEWTKTSKLNMLIKSCVFHYEFEFIHPFQDGNGRMGRMWHSLLLSTYQPMFGYLPVETIIKERQEEYYASLRASDSIANSYPFVEFFLQAVLDSLLEIEGINTLCEQVKKVIDAIGNETLSAKELMERVGLSHVQTFRKNYLNPSLEAKVIAMAIPDSPNSRNQKYFKC